MDGAVHLGMTQADKHTAPLCLFVSRSHASLRLAFPTFSGGLTLPLPIIFSFLVNLLKAGWRKASFNIFHALLPNSKMTGGLCSTLTGGPDRKIPVTSSEEQKLTGGLGPHSS
jgi:hypothetical protein